MEKHELTHMGLNAWGKKLFLVRYKGVSDVLAEDEIDNWRKEIDKIEEDEALNVN